MKFTQFTLVALVLALMVCALVACGGDAPAATEGDVTPNTEASPATDAETEPAAPAECQHTNVVEEVEEATCDSRGYLRIKCVDCDAQVSVKPIDMVDHIAAAPATCDAASVCKFCGTQLEAALGHKVETLTDSKEATPEEPGYEKGNCVNCGQEITKTVIFTNAVTFNKVAEGALNADDFKVIGFDTAFPKGTGAYTVVKDGLESYLSKDENVSTIYFKDQTGVYGTEKFEIVFDLRIDGASGTNSGIVALNDRTLGDEDEMRILSWSTAQSGGTVIYFGEPNAKGVPIKTVQDGVWFNVRIVVDPKTVNYEIYLNGSKAAYSTSDETAPAGHLVWIPKDGEWVSQSLEGFDVSVGKQTPFMNAGQGIKGVYLFHYSSRPCSIDNFDIHLISE